MKFWKTIPLVHGILMSLAVMLASSNFGPSVNPKHVLVNISVTYVVSA